MPATLKNKKKIVSRNRPLVHTEWAVFELDGDDNPIGGFYFFPSRAAARRGRDMMNNDPDSSARYGVFRRRVLVTRD